MKAPGAVEWGAAIMIRIAVVSAALLMMMSAGSAEDAPKQDAPKNDCASADIKAAEALDCAQTPRARVRRTTSTPDKPVNFLGNGYDARVMVPMYPKYEPYRAR
jgi:hypothetical protein